MYGYEAVRTLAALHRGRAAQIPVAGRGAIYIPCESISTENLEEFRARLKERAAAVKQAA